VVWVSVRVFGTGRVEQRNNDGGWSQGVYQGQNRNRETPGVCEGAREGHLEERKKEGKNEIVSTTLP
jgi:hypothetical protein